MKCHFVRSNLTGYLSGELDGDTRLGIERHIDMCPSCSSEINAEERVTERLKLLSIRPMPVETENRILQAVAEEKRRSAQAVRSFRFNRWAAVGAMALLLIFALLYCFRTSPVNHQSVPVVRKEPAGIHTPLKKTPEPENTAQHKALAPNGLKHKTPGDLPDSPSHLAADPGYDKPKEKSVENVQSAAQPGNVNTEAMVALIAVDQPVTDGNGRTLKTGDRLFEGSSIRTGEGGRATLITRSGSEFTLAPNSEFSLASRHVASLTRGRLYCSNRNNEIARIETPAGHVNLLGTVLDTMVLEKDKVAVTVVEGKVRLANSYGNTLVHAGKRSVLVANLPPEKGSPVNTFAETTWYDHRGNIQSDFGDITYTVEKEGGLLTEVWGMRADGSSKHRIASYIGKIDGLGPWLPGQQWLMLHTTSPGFTSPNLRTRRVVRGVNEEVLKPQMWLLNAVSGQTMPFPLSKRYTPFGMAFSPDGRYLAFGGRDHHERGNWANYENGMWIYDMQTGEVRRVMHFDGLVVTMPPAWAPDNRRLAFPELDDKNIPHLVIADIETGDMHRLDVTGAAPSFSPDGNRLAYVGVNAEVNSAEAQTGQLFILDLNSQDPPRALPTPPVTTFLLWSPDGSKILCAPEKECFYVVNADGSGLVEIPDFISGERGQATASRAPRVSWAPSDDAILMGTAEHVYLVAVDGSGMKVDLRALSEDDALSQEMEAQTVSAMEALHEAYFSYARGAVSQFKGNFADMQTSFKASSDQFASIIWQYPLSGLRLEDVLRYADQALSMSSRPQEHMLVDTCWEHMRIMRGLLCYYNGLRSLPPSLEVLESWASMNQWPQRYIGWITTTDADLLRKLSDCPGAGKSYNYTPSDGTLPELGAVLVTCPVHKFSIRWDLRYGKPQPVIHNGYRSGP